MNESDYQLIRQKFISDGGDYLKALEEKYSSKLKEIILENAGLLKADFDLSSDLYPFWANYPPSQRGRKPIGDSIPWIEVGQTTITSNLTRIVSTSPLFKTVRFPGLPSGGDFRFMTDDAFVHFDIKVTGPRDNTDEVVVSRNQVSGEGGSWNEKGILNKTVSLVSPRTTQTFHPELPPFYIVNGTPRICLTFFLKGIYEISGIGLQPLKYLELVCVPNGLLLFDGPNYLATHPDLIRPGKDDNISLPMHKRRRRIKLEPLARIADWRSIQFILNALTGKWEIRYRASNQS